MSNILIIGVAGGTGSGKTTLAKTLYREFRGESRILSHDFYYRSFDNLSYEKRCKINYDHPNSLDTELMIEHIKQLKAGKTIYHPTYNFEVHQRNEKLETMTPAKIIIVEGILIFENKDLLDLFDIRVYVDTDSDVRFIRRLNRDVKRRSRSMESVINQYLTTVKPMHDEFVEPSKRYADIIIPEGGQNPVAANMIIEGIKRKYLKK